MTKKLPKLSRLDLQILDVLWARGKASVREIQEGFPEPRPAYTTVQTMLNVLHRKAKVARSLEDRAYVYRAAVSRAHAVRHAMADIIDRMFGGSVESLVMSLVESRHVTPKKLAELTRRIEKKEGSDRGKA